MPLRLPSTQYPSSPPGLSPSNEHASSVGAVAFTVVMWAAWLGVTLVADFFAFLMFAFADSPGSGAAAQVMIVPAFAWFAITFVAGAVLLLRRHWWRIMAAFVLAVSPPFLIFAGYNLLAGGGGHGGSLIPAAGGTATATAPIVRVPPGGFRPPPMPVREQPDFRKAFPAAATTQPAPTTTQP